MLPPQIVAQTIVVMNARQRADKAYRDVMAITPNIGMAEVERLADEHSRLVALLKFEEEHLLSLVVANVNQSYPDLAKVKVQ